MKWFKLDSDTPNDPKIRSVLAKFGNDGFGILIRLWCYIAAHGTRKPGWSLDSLGKPIDKPVLIEAAGTSEENFDELMRECIRNGHFLKKPWKKRNVIAIPAMSRRADTYTHRHVRTNFEQTSNKVLLEEKRRRREENKTPLNPPFQGGNRPTKKPPTKKELHAAEVRRDRVHGGCPHSPRCSNYAACVAQLAREAKAKAHA